MYDTVLQFQVPPIIGSPHETKGVFTIELLEIKGVFTIKLHETKDVFMIKLHETERVVL